MKKRIHKLSAALLAAALTLSLIAPVGAAEGTAPTWSWPPQRI